MKPTMTRMDRQWSPICDLARKMFATLSVITALGIGFNSPAAAQAHLKYFGYVYAGETASDLAATYSYTNFAFTDGAYGESLVDRVNTMRSYNILAFIDLGRVLWVKNNAPGTPDVCPSNWTAEWCLPPDYRQRWQSWTQQNAAVLDSDHVLAFHIIGEASLLGIPPQDIDTATTLVKTTFPSINTVLVDAGICLANPPPPPESSDYKRCTSDGRFPWGFRNSRSADWVGLDQYQIHPTRDSNFAAEIASLKHQMYAGQQIVYVMDAKWDSTYTPYGISLSDMADITWEWYQAAASDPLAVMVAAFLWPSCPSSDRNFISICSKDFPPDVHAAQVSVGQNIVWQQYEGYLDQADCNVLAGWAWDRYLPNTPITVDIYANGVLQASGISASSYRADLAAAGKGNGYHAFVWTVPQNLKTGQTFSIVVNHGGTGAALGATPKWITCSQSPPSVSVAWIRPAEVTWGPPGTLTVAGYALNGTGGVQLWWRDVSLNGPWNAVGWAPVPDQYGQWSNTIPNSNNCHVYQVWVAYSGTYTSAEYDGPSSGYCHSSTIQVISGSYGSNCRAAWGNATWSLAPACNAQTACSYLVSYRVLGDPAPNCAKDFWAQWTCGSDPTSHWAYASPEAGYGSLVTLLCP